MKPRSRSARGGFSLVEVLISLGVFALASSLIWTCVDAVLYLSSKNTALSLSHTTLQLSLDKMSNLLRDSLQVIDVATFDGASFTHIDETTASNTEGSVSGNAVRFVRVLPGSYFLLPDDGTAYTMTNAQDPRGLTYPDYLTGGNKIVKATYAVPIPGLDTRDLAHARLFLRYPYTTETVSSGVSPGVKPGLDLSNVPTLTSGAVTFNLTTGLPAAAQTVPSCNQAFLIVESAAVVLNRTTYAELIYYPDANDLTRKLSYATSLGLSATGSGPAAFSLLRAAGPLSDPAARGSLRITLPVRSRDMDNTIARRGGTSALTNVALTVPVEARRRASF